MDRGRAAQRTGDLDWHRAHLRIAATETTALGNDLAKLAYLLEHPGLPSPNDDLPPRMLSARVALAWAHERQVALSDALAMPGGSKPPLAAGLTTDREASPSPALTADGSSWLPDWAPDRAPDWASQLQQRLADQ